MTLLPIVARELRVAARRPGTYRMRTLIALGAILIGCVLYGATLFAPAQQVGKYIFMGLSGLGLLHGLASGRRLTADCLSEEKREGTLGLLFLTDLKGHDVVLGKLAATSLSGFYGLLAVFPVLAIPLLLGGISNQEFWRMALVLVDAFVFSLAVGILASAVSREARRAMGSNFLLLLLLTAATPAFAAAIEYFSPSSPLFPVLMYPCPVYTFVLSFDARYATEANHFWWSAGVIHGLTWLLVALAGWTVPHAWQDKPAVSREEGRRWGRWWHAWSFGNAAGREAFRKRLLDVNAFYWLASRARLKPLHVWTFLVLTACWWLYGWLTNGRIWFDESVSVTTALILNTTLKLWVAVEAGQRLAEDRKMGALELILCTPLSVREMVRGQWLALRRQFLSPMMVIVAIELVLMAVTWRPASGWRVPAFWLAGLVMLVADVVALGWVAMSVALTAKSPQHASVVTVIRMLILPWLVFGMGVLLANLWSALTSASGEPLSWKFNLSLWFAVGIITDLVFGFMAQRRLLTGFRSLAMQRFAPASSPSRLARWKAQFNKAVNAISGSKRRRAEAAPPARGPIPRLLRGRKAALGVVFALSAVGLILAALRLRPSFPPPLIVPLAQSSAPLRVFPGNNNALLILPDGSLWRWGQLLGSPVARAIVPERIGTNTDWVDASLSYNHGVALRRDGTLWEWGQRADGSFSSEPVQAGSGSDWIGVSTGAAHSVALRRDGTLWAWGDNTRNQLGNGPGPNQTKLVQVGTNSDWASVCCQLIGTSALRTDGTFWAWGEFYSFRTSPPSVSTQPVPIQFCQETNWAAFASGRGDWMQAWTRSGELWDQFSATPNSNSPALATARLVLSNSAPDRVAFAFSDVRELYEARTNGTLWKRTYPYYGIWMPTAVGEWRQVGNRSDWVGIWGNGTALGLTSDGSVWTWGIDPSRDPVSTFGSKLQLLQNRISVWLGNRPVPTVTGSRPAIQKEPRPLLQLVPPDSNR